jgi:signal transduction histidine kinase
LDDVKEKILHLMELIAQLESMMSAGFFPICGEIREVDYIAFIDQLESFSRMNFEDPQTRLELAHDFLKVQNGLFEELSDKLAGFITEHEVSLPRFLEEFLQGVSDRKRIELEIQPDAGSLKVCVMEREGFLDKMKLIMENLLNNALEAGAESVQVRVYSPEPGTVNLDLKDDGPGIPPEILEELERQETYSLGEGGTGLIASKNACEILGGHLWINPEPMARGTLIRLALMAYLA